MDFHGTERKTRYTLVALMVLLVPAIVAESADVVDGKPKAGDEPVRIQLDPFMELCRGTYERSVAYTSLLVCWHDVRNAYGELAPTRVELLNYEPFVVLLHDVLHEGEIARLQKLGESIIKVSGLTNDSWVPVFYDNHQTFTLHDRDDTVVSTITQRVEQVTGLSCETAEDLKVIYDEIGSYKTLDMDVIQTPEDKRRFAYSGNRLATVLFFLTDEQDGGYTIFPKLRLTIRPKKGAAAMWYNLKETGEPHELMKYSNCPLMGGSKWTAKKILHTRGNEFRDPCRPKAQPSAN
ncbi:prolyl 4-hydroxylase subunit alpha-1-like [Anopheles ziemanni]|uniref:prolyl 4-hydroxylase subunit alpha-1-like n=1 Tax=Anopheles coustani TaxID=139045 RepID=UPI0026588B44|nr:prolyl 4-hydroxylase subunit alpha-1-like [Anopheles coustani]XP_058169168.1 prolyl 4-hydroxylase subunit alpha-1-like [Anopheles ziemanni]